MVKNQKPTKQSQNRKSLKDIFEEVLYEVGSEPKGRLNRVLFYTMKDLCTKET